MLCSRQHGALLQPLLGSPFFHDHDVAEGTFNKFYAYGFSSTPVFLVVFFFDAIFHCVTKSDAVKFHGMGSFTIPLWLFYALVLLTCREVELVMLCFAGVPLTTHRCAFRFLLRVGSGRQRSYRASRLHTNSSTTVSTGGSMAPSRCMKRMARSSSLATATSTRSSTRRIQQRLRVDWHLHAEGQGRAALGQRSEEGHHLRASEGCRAHVRDGCEPSQVH